MLTFRRPILAASLLPPTVEHTNASILAAMQKLRYPVLATLKLDGIRALRLDGSLLSRTRKPIPNKSIRERSLIMPGGFDLELWSPSLRYDEIESIVMSREHPNSDKIEFHVLDWFGSAVSYDERTKKITQELSDSPINKYRTDIIFEVPVLCTSPQMLLHAFWMAEANEGEGICFRLPNSPYKQGRSTLKEQYLIKLARYSYAEATIVGFIEQQENGNKATTNSLGLTERSSHGADMCGKNTLGAFLCGLASGETITIGTGVGLTNEVRRYIWEHKLLYIGHKVKFKYKSHGQKNLPRSPIFVGFRSEIDI